MKGQVDIDNMETSLNVLFDVFLKFNILLSSHIPFVTESMYQNMKNCISEDSKMQQDSIHHLAIPQAVEELKNEEV